MRFSPHLTTPSAEVIPEVPDWTHVYPAGPGFVSRAGLTNVTQQGKDGSFPQATAVFELVQVLREKMKGGVSLGGQRPLRSPPASSASQTAECWYYTRVQGSWLEAAGAAGLAPGLQPAVIHVFISLAQAGRI